MAETATADPIEEPTEIGISDEVRTLDFADEPLVTLAIEERRIGLRIVPYNVVAEHPIYGPLLFEPGAFGTVDPRYGVPEGQPDHQDAGHADDRYRRPGVRAVVSGQQAGQR